jgi:hypothetical protein
MVRITQLGTGNALVVEDSANPDSTPFVIRADGKVGVGTTGMIQYGSGASDTSTFGILASTGNDSAFVLKGNNGSTTDGSGQTLVVLVGATGSSGSGTNITHLSHNTSGIGTRRNSIRFTDTQIRFEDNVSGSVDVTINSSGSGELLVGRTSSTGTSNQLLQVQGGAYILDSVGIGTTNPLDKLHVLGDFLVAAGSSTGQHITQKAYELNNGTMSWEGSAGQLFSITNNLTSGSIFSVNDVSGIPSIDVDANGTIALAPYGTTENVGVGTTSPTSKLTVEGNALITGILTATTGLGGDAFESYEIDLVPYTSYNLRTVATTITFDDSNTTDVALYGTIVELPIEDNDFIEDSTYIPYFDGEVVSIINPFKLMITVNGVLQSAFINNTDNVYQSNFLGSHNGYTIDSDNNIKFTESIPTGSDIVARVLPASSTATKIKNYPFKPTDIVLGY